VNQEYIELRESIVQLDRLVERFDKASQTLPPPKQEPKIEKPALKNAHGVVMTADLAEYVIRVHGPRLHINKIIDGMRAEGWPGSGDPRRDYKSVIQNLKDKIKRFRNIGKNVWELVGGGE
jgi:hypothetical protein